VVLPPGWVHLPLHDAHARVRVLDALVRSTKLDDGAGAQLRRELRTELGGAADDAAAAGAIIFALCATAGPGGVPLPASLVVTPLDVDENFEIPAQTGAGAGDSSDDDQGRLPIGRAVRRVAHQRPAEGLPSFRAEYWVTPDEDCGGYHVVLSTPLVSHADAMLELFDAVLTTARVGPI
jgi:hypothetical protein